VENKYSKPKWFATYAKWLKVHDFSHKEYEARKKYPWHIISKINFDPNINFFESFSVIYPKDNENKALGKIELIDYLFRQVDQRHQYDFSIDDYSNNVHWQFRIVFSDEGTLITIHKRGVDVYKSIGVTYIQRGEVVLGENPSRKILDSCGREIFNIAMGHLEDSDFKYGKRYDVVWPSLQSENVVKHKKLFVDFSDMDKNWFIFAYTESKANTLALRLDGLEKNITIIYLLKTNDPKKYYGNKIQLFKLADYQNAVMSIKVKSRLRDLEKLSYLFYRW